MSVDSETSWGQAAAVFYADQYLPIYFEISAKITAQKPLAGWKANSYVIFDYRSPTDFKWAGINISNDQIEMGYRDASGWHQVAKSNKPVQLKAGITYDVLVAVNGTNVTVTVEVFSCVNFFVSMVISRYAVSRLASLSFDTFASVQPHVLLTPETCTVSL